MAGSTYSSNLKIELMTTGENSGTWGDVTNTNLGTALEQAVVGYGNPDYASDANLTISITNSNASQAARCLVLNVTSTFGSLTATRELVVPTIQKQYIVQNNTTGGQSITVKTSAGTGITVPNGRKAHLYVNGTDVIQMFDFVDINGGTIDGTAIGGSSASTGAFTTLNASGATTLDGNVTLGNASGDNVTVTGTITSNLLFTDNTYDIGASGATRPRNLFLAGAATIGGNLSVGGTLTLTGGVNLNGNVTVGDNATDTLTINSTITSNLIFTDNTYDIGASGATRPRNLFLAGNATIGGNQTLTGSLTVDSTTDSSSTITGSIQTDGGLGVAKALYVGTNVNIGGLTASKGVFTDGSKNLTSTGTLGTDQGGTGLTSFTANGVVYASSTSALTTGSALQFDGSRLGVGISPTQLIDANGAILARSNLIAYTALVLQRSSSSLELPVAAYTNGSGNILASNTKGDIVAFGNVGGDGVIFANANIEQMRLTSTGLGIGTSSPGAKLQVKDGTNINVRVGALGGYASVYSINDAGSAYQFLRIDATDLLLNTYSGGNVGIGTGSPGNLLHIASANTGKVEFLRLQSTSGYASGGGAFMRAGSAGVDSILFGFDYNSSSFQIQNGNTAAAVMTVQNGGNLGIGTTSPQNRLDLGGPSAGRGITWENYVNVFSEYSSGALYLSSNYYGNTDSVGFKTSLTASFGAAGISVSGTSGAGTSGLIQFFVDPATSKTAGNAFTPTERARISSDGTFRVKGAGTAGSTDAVQFAGSAPASSLTLDGSGRLLVGLTSSKNNDCLFQVEGSLTNGGQIYLGNSYTSETSSVVYGRVNFVSNVGSVASTVASILATNDGNHTSSTNKPTCLVFYTTPSGSATQAERARITSGGYFKASNTGTYLNGNYHELYQTATDERTLVANSSNATTPLGILVNYSGASPNDTGKVFLECRDSGPTTRASIRSNGGLANYSANDVNLSDRREKTNFAPAGEYLSKICAIPVQTFNYIDQNLEEDAGLTLGVVAQDVQAVAPELVMESNWGTEEEPKMRLSIYQTDLQYALMKCIQEQQAIIEQLKARLDAANL